VSGSVRRGGSGQSHGASGIGPQGTPDSAQARQTPAVCPAVCTLRRQVLLTEPWGPVRDRGKGPSNSCTGRPIGAWRIRKRTPGPGLRRGMAIPGICLDEDRRPNPRASQTTTASQLRNQATRRGCLPLDTPPRDPWRLVAAGRTSPCCHEMVPFHCRIVTVRRRPEPAPHFLSRKISLSAARAAGRRHGDGPDLNVTAVHDGRTDTVSLTSAARPSAHATGVAYELSLETR
jgi:hypothetical protein